jgi:phospholipase/carboxylesterase
MVKDRRNKMNSPLYYELRKPREESNKRYPALFLMHGMGSNEKDLLSLAEGLEENFYIFSIRGHLEQPPGYAFFTIEGYGKPHREAFDEAISKVTNFIDYACEKYPVDENGIYLLGFSQGAILSMSLGLSLGNRIKGIMALSGYVPDLVKNEYNIKPVENLSLFISHGEMDNILPFEWGINAKEYFEKLGAVVDFHSYKAGHTVSLQNYQDCMKWLKENLNV